MFNSYRRFLLCRRYQKDIWGYIIGKHKTVNFAWVKVWPNVEDVPHLAKKKWLLQDVSKRLSATGFWFLGFSFEIIRRMKKKWPWKMKNWMRFFFLTKILRLFYGNLKKHWFKNICNNCIAKNINAIFLFMKLLEFWLPMFIYWIGFAPTLFTAKDWVNKGLIKVNNKICWNDWQPIKLYDFISFDVTLWKFITLNLVKLFFYGSKAARWRRCISSKIWSLKKVTRAHFISFPDYFFVDIRTFSVYWWREALPSSIKFYFSVNISNILKYVTI